ncbi:hypothetical protein ACFW4Q_02375 [Streptomyces rochei]|uniref:hypothetical protein n=1 Tax=Streptomyces rochei TaxID=1928 RepID=UPI00369BBB7E
MTADCEPTWLIGLVLPDRTPTLDDLRRAELDDLHDQGAGPKALRTAHTIDPGSYL